MTVGPSAQTSKVQRFSAFHFCTCFSLSFGSKAKSNVLLMSCKHVHAMFSFHKTHSNIYSPCIILANPLKLTFKLIKPYLKTEKLSFLQASPQTYLIVLNRFLATSLLIAFQYQIITVSNAKRFFMKTQGLMGPALQSDLST